MKHYSMYIEACMSLVAWISFKLIEQRNVLWTRKQFWKQYKITYSHMVFN